MYGYIVKTITVLVENNKTKKDTFVSFLIKKLILNRTGYSTVQIHLDLSLHPQQLLFHP